MNAMKILIADAHPLYREGLEQVLYPILPQATIFMASDDTGVLELLEIEPIDLIFLDFNLPSRSGIVLTKSIRHINIKVKIVIVSATDDRFSVMKSFQAGANGFLNKNSDETKILTAVESIMSGETYLPKEFQGFGDVLRSISQTSYNMDGAFEILSKREIEILVLFCKRLSSKEIADKLSLTEETIETYRTHLMMKTRSKNLVGLTMFAIEKGYIIPQQHKNA